MDYYQGPKTVITIKLDYRLRTTNYKLRYLDQGLWTNDNRLRHISYKPRFLDQGLWT